MATLLPAKPFEFNRVPFNTENDLLVLLATIEDLTPVQIRDHIALLKKYSKNPIYKATSRTLAKNLMKFLKTIK